ncbi:uncharacterized protein IL334_001444 [Kwoniella shivajii]|uniref:VPS37 C-terminal domain-containing protein n=1 Tax=Kwoniella shivajii TaxID=564305 RepID=A0ABZ1CW50_9TREE|nr:hypothetical protein IL334_001444 [Kwoniella shivajii]
MSTENDITMNTDDAAPSSAPVSVGGSMIARSQSRDSFIFTASKNPTSITFKRPVTQLSSDSDLTKDLPLFGCPVTTIYLKQADTSATPAQDTCTDGSKRTEYTGDRHPYLHVSESACTVLVANKRVIDNLIQKYSSASKQLSAKSAEIDDTLSKLSEAKTIIENSIRDFRVFDDREFRKVLEEAKTKTESLLQATRVAYQEGRLSTRRAEVYENFAELDGQRRELRDSFGYHQGQKILCCSLGLTEESKSHAKEARYYNNQTKNVSKSKQWETVQREQELIAGEKWDDYKGLEKYLSQIGSYVYREGGWQDNGEQEGY